MAPLFIYVTHLAKRDHIWTPRKNSKTKHSVSMMYVFSISSLLTVIIFSLRVYGWVQHYPKCLYFVQALRIVLHSPINIPSKTPASPATSLFQVATSHWPFWHLDKILIWTRSRLCETSRSQVRLVLKVRVRLRMYREPAGDLTTCTNSRVSTNFVLNTYEN